MKDIIKRIALLLALAATAVAEPPKNGSESDSGTVARRAMVAVCASGESLDIPARDLPLSLLEPLRFLQACHEQAPGQRQVLFDNLLESDPADDIEGRIVHLRRSAPAETVMRLRREDRYNRFVLLANYFADLGTDVLSGNIQGLFRGVADLFFLPAPLLRLTPRERQILDVYRRWEARVMLPPSPHDPPGLIEARQEERAALVALRPLAVELQKRLDRWRVQEANVLGGWHLKHQRPHEARAAFARARLLDSDDDRARAGELRASRQISARHRAAEKSMSMPPVSTPQDTPERVDITNIMAAALTGEPPLTERTHAFLTRHPNSNFADAARYMAGGAPSEGSGAEALLELHQTLPWLSTEARLNHARACRRADNARYIFLGLRPQNQTPEVWSAQDRVHRVVRGLGVLLPFQWIVRGVRVSLSKPVDDAYWREVALRHLRAEALRHPGDRSLPLQQIASSPTSDTQEVALDLADSYRHMNRFDAALAWHGWAIGPDANYRAKLNKKAARRWLHAARAESEPDSRAMLLRGLRERFPETRSARKAERMLEEEGMDKRAPWLVLSRTALEAMPEVWGDRGLDLPGWWIDGDVTNGEITERGLRFLMPDGRRVHLTMERNGEQEERTLDLDKATWERVRVPLNALRSDRESHERAERLLEGYGIPFELEGAAGPGGVDVQPRLLPIPFEQEDLPLYR